MEEKTAGMEEAIGLAAWRWKDDDMAIEAIVSSTDVVVSRSLSLGAAVVAGERARLQFLLENLTAAQVFGPDSASEMARTIAAARRALLGVRAPTSP